MGVPLKHEFRPSPRWAFMEWCDIPSYVNPGEVYLRRLRIWQNPWFGIMLHFIFEPDTDPDPHNHPWTFWSVILRGGYWEEVSPFPWVHAKLQRTMFQWMRWSIHKFSLDSAHKIKYIMPGTVTLIITGRRRRSSWGFFTADGFIPYKEYHAVRNARARSILHQQVDPWES